MHSFTLLVAAVVAAGLALDYWLLLRQQRHVARHRNAVPEPFRDRVTLDEHQRAADYTLAKIRPTWLELPWGVILLLLWLGGGIALLDQWLAAVLHQPLLHGTALILTVLLVSTLLELPFSLYRVFGIESRFGFNRTTAGRFALDLLLQFGLLLLLGGALIGLILWLMISLGSWWWLAAWLVWSLFSLLLMWLFPTVIAPLFNRFTPLPEGPLRERIEQLLARCGFRSQGIFVMDGSRRSSHGNAYFSGMGAAKRIVFFDTLLEKLQPDEVEAVLAHELGHYHHKHIRNLLLLSFASSLLLFALIGWTLTQPWFYSGLGITNANPATSLLLLLLLLPYFTRFSQPLMAWYQRRNEFQADRFAAQQSGAEPLIQALLKLYRDNAATLTPDPLYSAFHDSHPPAPLRIAHLREL